MPFRRGRVATTVVTIGLGGGLNIRPGKETISSWVYFFGDTYCAYFEVLWNTMPSN